MSPMPPPTTRTIVSVRIRTVRARLFQEQKKKSAGNFNCAALRAQILTLNYCAEVGVRVSRRFAKKRKILLILILHA